MDESINSRGTRNPADPRKNRDVAQKMIGPAITDVAGEPAARTQIERLIARYHWAAGYITRGVVVEVACGTGQGLGLLSSKGNRVVGFDLSLQNLGQVRETYDRSLPLVCGNAQTLPFGDASIDVVLLLETIYFLKDPLAFIREAARVLKPGGKCLISSINKDCPDFNPNHPLYYAHYGAPELSSMLRANGFGTQCFGIIPMDKPTFRGRVFRPMKQIAIRFNLIPDSMQARLFLKRVVFGRLTRMPRDIRGNGHPITRPLPIPGDEPDTTHQVILCAGLRA